MLKKVYWVERDEQGCVEQGAGCRLLLIVWSLYYMKVGKYDFSEGGFCLMYEGRWIGECAKKLKKWKVRKMKSCAFEISVFALKEKLSFFVKRDVNVPLLNEIKTFLFTLFFSNWREGFKTSVVIGWFFWSRLLVSLNYWPHEQ